MKKTIITFLIAFIAGFLSMNCSKNNTTTPESTIDQPHAVTLSATDSTATSINLVWTSNGDSDFLFYRLYRCNEFANYLVKTISTKSDTSYKDSLLSPSHSYTYFVSVVDTGNLASQSNILPVRTLGTTGLRMGMDPRYLETELGRTYALEVWIENVDSLFGASFELSYDSTSMVSDSAKVGSFLGGEVIFFNHTEPGLASISITLKSGAVEASGNGSLAVVYFHTIGTGSKNITFSPTLALRKANGANVTGFSSIVLWTSTLLIQ